MVKRTPFFANSGKILKISIGLVYTLFTLWLIFHTAQYVPVGKSDYWFKIFLAYGLLNALIFGNADLRNKLFNVKFLDFILKFLLFFFLSLFVFFSMNKYFGNVFGASYFTILKSVPLWLACIHSFVFAMTESIVWQGYLDDYVGKLGSAGIFGIFHWGIWEGSAFIVIPLAAILCLFFSFIHWYFRSNVNDFAPVTAVHTAWNYSKLALGVM